MLGYFLIPLLGFGSLLAAPLNITVSVGPTKSLIEKIAGPLVTVNTFVPAGASPHSYEPTPKQLLQTAQTHIWFQIGEGFEGKALDALSSKTEIVNLRDGLDLISSCCSCHDIHDPHFWLSPKLLHKQALHIHSVLSRHLPEHQAILDTHLATLLEELRLLDQEISTLLANAPSKTILVSHAAFGYFCRDYGLTQLSIEVDGKEPTVKQMTALLSLAKKEGIDRIFLEPQHSAKGGLRLASELGITVEWLDPYKADVIDNLRTIAKAFAQRVPR